jgi:hypothetical protein
MLLFFGQQLKPQIGDWKLVGSNSRNAVQDDKVFHVAAIKATDRGLKTPSN